MNTYQRLLLIIFSTMNFCVVADNRVTKQHNQTIVVPQKIPLDLSLPNQQVDKKDEHINLEPQKDIEKPNVFEPKTKEETIKLKGKLIMSPETEKNRSTVDGAGVTMDLKL